MIGRAPLNDIVLEEPGVSRQRAGIRGGRDGYWIADLGSRNGTFINGEKIATEPRRLKNFDRIELGGTNTTVHWASWSRKRPSRFPAWSVSSPEAETRKLLKQLPNLRFCLPS